MNKTFLKQTLLILTIMLICSGCKQNNILGKNFSIDKEDIAAVKYKNGAILVKSNEIYDMTNKKNFVNPEANVGEIKFGPRNVNFAN